MVGPRPRHPGICMPDTFAREMIKLAMQATAKLGRLATRGICVPGGYRGSSARGPCGTPKVRGTASEPENQAFPGIRSIPICLRPGRAWRSRLMPRCSVVVVRAAVVPVRSTVACVDRPCLNVTGPIGVHAPGAAAATVAVKVNDCPTTEGFAPVVCARWP